MTAQARSTKRCTHLDQVNEIGRQIYYLKLNTKYVQTSKQNVVLKFILPKLIEKRFKISPIRALEVKK